ncbi:MAG: tetratricopeptide repeat protein [Saprospiraceae bacterium]|jgi:Ca-activated chloride channel family protein|nr:tetratricopeptide repeat protein [Saprospiraceae bacterium]HQV67566.1 tetratricopeptide repeat protein [Saprospiraceae bacterium]
MISNKNRTTLLFAICLFPLLAVSQSAHKSLRKGDAQYKDGKYLDAETAYRKADGEKSSVKSAYNLGNSLMKQNRYDEAITKYDDAAAKTNSDSQKANIYFNQGNAYYNKKEYQQSIESYKKALRHQSEDATIKENLALARLALRKQQQEQQKQQNKENNKENDQNKDQNQQDNSQQNQDQNQQKEQNQQNEQNENNNKDQSQSQNKKLSEAEARKLLEIMDNEEKKVQQKLRRTDGGNKRVKKDW